MDYKYHNDYNRAEEMLRMSVKQETNLTFSILVIALASLFVSGPGNQQVLAQGVGGGGGAAGGGGGGGGAGGGGSFASSGGAEGGGGGGAAGGGGSFASSGGAQGGGGGSEGG